MAAVSLPRPTPLSSLPGGTAAFTSAFETTFVAASIGQTRLREALETIGPPTPWKADPIAGTLELRGKTFAAELLGTFDGTSWLWAWANPFLKLPDDRTTLSRGARDASAVLGAPVLGVPFVDLEGQGGPHHVAVQVVGNGFGDAYYVCDFPDNTAVYALAEGELPARLPRLHELQRAMTEGLATGLANPVAALTRATAVLGLHAERTDGAVIVRDGAHALTAVIEGDRIAKITSTIEI